MPSWDKEKAHQWYLKHKEELRLKKRRRYLAMKKKVRENASVSSERS
jgi:hypothetical protein